MVLIMKKYNHHNRNRVENCALALAAGLAFLALPGPAVAAQDLPVQGDGAAIPVEGGERTVSSSRAQGTARLNASDRRLARLPGHVSIVVTDAGILADGYERRRICVASNCAQAVVETASGDVVYLDGEWMVGYLVTRNGEEVWHIGGMPERAAQHASRQQALEP